MKRKVLLFLIIVFIVSLGIFLGIKYLDNDERKPIDNPNKDDDKIVLKALGGEKIDDRTYSFTNKKTRDSYNSMYVKDNKIYYLKYKNNTIYLSYQDIFTGELKEIGSKKIKNDSCYFEPFALKIRCVGDKQLRYYDENLKLINEYKSKDFAYPYVPYKSEFINSEKIEDMNHDKLMYVNYYQSQDNTYIIYFKSRSDMLTIYDVKNKKIYNEYYNHYGFFEDGLVIINDEEIKKYDLSKDEVKITKSALFMNKDISDLSATSLDGRLYATYNSYNKKMYVQDTNESKILELDLSKLKFEYVMQILIEDNYIYICDAHDKKDVVYAFDITGLKFTDIKEYKKNIAKGTNDKVKKIKDKFNINVLVKDKATVAFPDFTAEYSDDDIYLNAYLDEIIKVAGKFSREFFDKFYEDGMDGINIYLTGSLKPKNEFQYSSPAAYTLIYKNKYTMVFDVKQGSIEDNICHEMSHTLENLIENDIKIFEEIYEKWDDYNPDGYDYKYSYTEDFSDKYTIGTANKKNVYFISSYSNSYPTEDRAQIFGYVCSNNKDLLKYDKLVKKAKYMQDEISKFYPSLDDAPVFDLLK